MKSPSKSSRSLLISYAGYPYSPSSFMPDNGLALLAAILLKDGHETKILDFGTVEIVKKLMPEFLRRRQEKLWDSLSAKTGERISIKEKLSLFLLDKLFDINQNVAVSQIAREIADICKQENIDFVGFKLWMGDGFAGSIKIAKFLRKKYPKLKLFAGGPLVDLAKERILDKFGFDALIQGEGEGTISKLAEYSLGSERLENIPNLIFHKNGDVVCTPIERVRNLDDLPYAAYNEDVYGSMHNDQKIKILSFDESRGCPNNCAFCVHPQKSGNLQRTKSVERILDELEFINKHYGTNVYKFAGSNTPPDLLKNLSEAILRRRLKLRYTTFVHARDPKSHIFDLIKRSGGFAVFFGIESGSQTILDRMNKRSSIDQIKQAVKFAKQAGLFTVGSVIFPAPFETEETKMDTLKLLDELKLDSVPVQFPALFPGTLWWQTPLKYKFQIDNMNSFYQTLMAYKIKLNFPPKFWKPLPYRLNGKSYRSFMDETEKFIKILEEKGFVTSIADDIALMADICQIPLKEFVAQFKKSIFCGDHQSISQLIKRINSRIEEDMRYNISHGN